MIHKTASGESSGYAVCKLEFCSSSSHNSPTTMTTAPAGPLHCIHQGHNGFQPKWFQPSTTHTCRRRANIQNNKGHPRGSQSSATITKRKKKTPLVQDFINRRKVQTLWCTLDNTAAGKAMPAVIFNGAVDERTNHLRHFEIDFDRMLTYGQYVETTALKGRKGLSVLRMTRLQRTTTPLPAVSKCGAQRHRLPTRPLNSGTDKSAKAGQNAERGNASRTQNHQEHTH